MIKLKTNQAHRMGTSIILPVIGETEVSKEGYISVDSKEKAQKLVDAEVGFGYDDSSFLNHVGSEEELVGQNDSLKDVIEELRKEKNEAGVALKVSEDRNVKLTNQLSETTAKYEAGKNEIIELRTKLDETKKSLKEAKLGFIPEVDKTPVEDKPKINEVKPKLHDSAKGVAPKL